jgi:hypothetical protein
MLRQTWHALFLIILLGFYAYYKKRLLSHRAVLNYKIFPASNT